MSAPVPLELILTGLGLGLGVLGFGTGLDNIHFCMKQASISRLILAIDIKYCNAEEMEI